MSGGGVVVSFSDESSAIVSGVTRALTVIVFEVRSISATISVSRLRP